MFRYATPAVTDKNGKNGRATLKGIVDSDSHRQYALNAARSVPGLFDVRNALHIQ